MEDAWNSPLHATALQGRQDRARGDANRSLNTDNSILKSISIPRRFTAPMREMLAMQPRFDARQGKRALRLLENRRFRAAYDFMMLRAECGEMDSELADFWTRVQSQSANERLASFGLGNKPRSSKRRRPRRRKKPGASTA